MKKIIWVSVLLLYSQLTTAQSIQLYVYGGLTSHWANLSLDNPPTEPKVPSIGVFYSNAPIFGTKALFYINNLRVESSSFFAGVVYEHSELSSEIEENVLGEDLIINTVGLSVGYKTGKLDSNSKFFVSVSVDYLKKFYSGYNDFGSGITSISNYIKGSAFRVTLEPEYFSPEDLPFIIGLSLSMEFGSVRRDVVEFYYNDEYQAELEPTGDLVLPDDVMNIMLNISYLFSL